MWTFPLTKTKSKRDNRKEEAQGKRRRSLLFCSLSVHLRGLKQELQKGNENPMAYKRPPDTYDVLPYPNVKEPWLHTAKWRFVEGVFREVCGRYGYKEIRTPILEQTDLFKRTAGETTDVVSKEMFTFEDRGGRSMTMKPEGTAPVVRACIENGIFATHPTPKLYYIGQHFRYERGQKGRYRQHQQLGVEVFGADNPAIDAEVILLAMSFYREVGVKDQVLRINSLGIPESRVKYREALRNFVRPFLSEMSEEGQGRFEANPLRMLDTKSPKELELLSDAPRLIDFLDAESAEHFGALQGYLNSAGVPYEIDHRLVRGFDYYTRTTFEIAGASLGAQNALGGGGRYDGLVEACGGPKIPGIGFGLGMERCLISLEAMGVQLSIQNEETVQVFLITLGDASIVEAPAVKLLSQLREAGISADKSYRSRKFPQQIKEADEAGASYTLILGDSEIERGVVQLRNQKTKEQTEINLSEIVGEIKKISILSKNF